MIEQKYVKEPEYLTVSDIQCIIKFIDLIQQYIRLDMFTKDHADVVDVYNKLKRMEETCLPG
jgi:hypothetical protein